MRPSRAIWTWCGGSWRCVDNRMERWGWPHRACLSPPPPAGRTFLLSWQRDESLLHTVHSIDGKTLLILACRGGSLDMVNFLLDRGARLEQQDYFGLTALWLSVCDGHDEVMMMMMMMMMHDSVDYPLHDRIIPRSSGGGSRSVGESGGGPTGIGKRPTGHPGGARGSLTAVQ
jgi:hypothetical protein